MTSRPRRLLGVAAAAAVAALAGASLAAFAGAGAWWLDLLSHFRPHYAAAGAAALAAALVLGRPRTAAVAAAVCALNAVCLSPGWLRVTRAVPEGAPRLSLLLSNVSLENRNDALPALLASRYDPDVLGFIEVDARWLRVLDAGLPDHPHRIRADARDDHYGIALYSRRPLLSAETIPVNDPRYPALLVELRVGARPVRVLLAHAHPPFQVRVARMRDRQLARVAEIRRAHAGPFVLLGDLNATPWSHPFRALLATTDLRDTRRGFGLQATWPAGLPLGRIPLDHCLASPEWVVVRREVGPPVGSDHLPVFVELALDGPS